MKVNFLFILRISTRKYYLIFNYCLPPSFSHSVEWSSIDLLHLNITHFLLFLLHTPIVEYWNNTPSSSLLFPIYFSQVCIKNMNHCVIIVWSNEYQRTLLLLLSQICPWCWEIMILILPNNPPGIITHHGRVSPE